MKFSACERSITSPRPAIVLELSSPSVKTSTTRRPGSFESSAMLSSTASQSRVGLPNWMSLRSAFSSASRSPVKGAPRVGLNRILSEKDPIFARSSGRSRMTNCSAACFSSSR